VHCHNYQDVLLKYFLQAVNQYKEIMTRTIMSMIITAIGNESYTNVKIISTWSKNLNKSDFEGIPATASVPRFVA
jgi:hypothetical protein